jgi:hypothetical protein
MPNSWRIPPFAKSLVAMNASGQYEPLLEFRPEERRKGHKP